MSISVSIVIFRMLVPALGSNSAWMIAPRVHNFDLLGRKHALRLEVYCFVLVAISRENVILLLCTDKRLIVSL